MKSLHSVGLLLLGLAVGVSVSAWNATPKIAFAASNDRYEDFSMATGIVATTRNAPTEGVWMLDSRAGKLMGGLIDRGQGKIGSWAEVDLIQDFALPAKQHVHFVMTTGIITQGQSALYVAEPASGKFGIYTMGMRPDGQAGMSIRRHDLTTFRPIPR
ncbi:MAG: hypothetical protein K2X38_24300 [Gemmataceae bacterium]|nr:hypothetical protein [Gemmataceae bacterium]